MTAQQLLEKGGTILGELEDLQSKRVEAEGDEATKLDEQIQAKEKVFDGLEAQIEKAKLQAKRREALVAARKELEAAPAGDVSDPGEPTVPTTAKDEQRNERKLAEGVRDYMLGKTLSGQMRQALRPKSDKFSEAGGAEGVALPKSVTARIFGQPWADVMFGKENPLTSAGTGYGEANLVPQEYIAQLLRLPGEPAHILQMATVVPCATGTLTYPRLAQSDTNEYGGVAFTWINEAAAKPETRPEFEQITIDAHELAGHTQISLRLLSRSAISLEALLASLYRDAAYNTLDTAFLTGTGTGQPLGVVNDANVRSVARTVANQVEWTDLVNVQFALMRYHRSGARYFIDDSVESHLMLIHEMNYANQPNRNARPIYTAGIANGPYDRLAGYPFITTERQPNLGSAGDVIFGDWSKYFVAMEQDVVIKRSDHYEFLNNVATFICYLVVGGRAALPRAFCYLEAGTS